MNLSRAFLRLLSSSSSSSSSSPQSHKWLLLRRIPIVPPHYSALSSAAAAAAASPTKRPSYNRKPKPKPEPEPELEPAPAPEPEKDSSLGLTSSGWKPQVQREKGPWELPRPSTIPFQAKVANCVQFVGTIGVPVQLQRLPDGQFTAVSVLVCKNTNGFLHFWIPVIFQDDLAQIAACHLKENDLVHIEGELSGDAPPFQDKGSQANIQILAHSVSFVQNECKEKDSKVADKKDAVKPNHSVAEIEENSPMLHLWNDLLANPQNWWDNRSNKTFPKSAAFKHKVKGELLWLNESTPDWVLSKLDTLSFGPNRTTKRVDKDNTEKSENPTLKLWYDLVSNPQQWRDNRMDKQNGKKIPKFPDFKHKDNENPLWLNTAPQWVVKKLDGLVFYGSCSTSNQEVTINEAHTQINDIGKVSRKFKGKEHKEAYAVSDKKTDVDLWKNLVENPKEWWDNRANKFNPKSPDFKHKESGEVLWLRPSTPEWIVSKLPPLNTKAGNRKKASAGSAS
ncbi:protein OSB2, chloroplastic isoform X1 [Ananas comosus]|uniref:Protein OSB2, chloroplastic isoform X1 n=1 Tax=Ananas comosus TaxID=4615 RepID=A0A199VXQ5_ANACO|nr:protein OSB2, chloroplastic isoform X1 [Ananas comosus]OAY82032.1 Protein OSB3, chloroplastic/mitochondrial [Ananas comosus]